MHRRMRVGRTDYLCRLWHSLSLDGLLSDVYVLGLCMLLLDCLVHSQERNMAEGSGHACCTPCTRCLRCWKKQKQTLQHARVSYVSLLLEQMVHSRTFQNLQGPTPALNQPVTKSTPALLAGSCSACQRMWTSHSHLAARSQ